MRQQLRYLIVLIGALAIIAWTQRSDGRLHVIVLPTKGDAILIRSPNGAFTMIDGGGNPTDLAVELGAHMPFWERKLAAIILTRAAEQNTPGQLGVLRRYQPMLALTTVIPDGEWHDLLSALATPVHRLQAGQQINLGGALLQVLTATDGDEGGAVLLIKYRATRILIHTGGSAGDSALAELAGQHIDLLIYPWQRPITVAEIEQLRIRAVAFSDGFEAAEPALQSFHERKQLAPYLYHPELDGTIHLVSDGQRIAITTQLP
ncbi:hypothetical protein [Chloroflexus sp.]|uniref:hypothetical protein n=1 Tax=Chloroflexus sp. TaxID=1904827 RepID=UPI00263059F2|nr:hypothetical protein [uncultured Chloroflexus sp.]